MKLFLEVIPPFEQDDDAVLADLAASVAYWRAAIRDYAVAASPPRSAAGKRSPADAASLLGLQRLAIRLAADATRLHRERREGRRSVRAKSTAMDLISDVDGAAQDLLVATLRRERPGDGILAEEDLAEPGGSGVRWIIDPLDGTANYLLGYPAYGAAIAVEVGGEARVAAVSDSMTGSIFTAVKGRGATCDGRPLSVRRPASLATAVGGHGFLL